MVTLDVFKGQVKAVLLKFKSVGGFNGSIVIGAATNVQPLASLIVIV